MAVPCLLQWQISLDIHGVILRFIVSAGADGYAGVSSQGYRRLCLLVANGGVPDLYARRLSDYFGVICPAPIELAALD